MNDNMIGITAELRGYKEHNKRERIRVPYLGNIFLNPQQRLPLIQQPDIQRPVSGKSFARKEPKG
jgi:hypothetical protein